MDDELQSVSSLRSRFEHMSHSNASTSNSSANTTPPILTPLKPTPPPIPANRPASRVPNKPHADLHESVNGFEPKKDASGRAQSVAAPSSSSTLRVLAENTTPSKQRPLSMSSHGSRTPMVIVDSPRSPPREDHHVETRLEHINAKITPLPSPRIVPITSQKTTPPAISSRPISIPSKPDGYFNVSMATPPVPERPEVKSRRQAPLSATMQALRDHPGKPGAVIDLPSSQTSFDKPRSGLDMSILRGSPEKQSPLHESSWKSVRDARSSIDKPRASVDGGESQPSSGRLSPFLDPSFKTSTGSVPKSGIVRGFAELAPPIPARPERILTMPIASEKYVNGSLTRSQTDLLPTSRQSNQSATLGTTVTRKSPFNTPPSSDGSPNSSQEGLVPPRALKPKLDGTSPFAPPPLHPAIADHRRQPPPPPANPPKLRTTAPIPPLTLELPASAPSLPPRQLVSTPIEARSEISSSSYFRGRSHSPTKSFSVVSSNADIGDSLAPPKKIHSAIKTPSPNREPDTPTGHRHTHSMSQSQRSFSITSTATARTYNTDTTYVEEDTSDDNQAPSDPNEYPDSSGANRRRPVFTMGPREINCKYDVKLFAVCGQFVCTSAHTTRVWNIHTGEHIMTLHHGETARISAMAFKPAKDLRDEGTHLWLGTQTGELMEIDIRTQKILYSRTSAHTKKEVVKIHRHAYELWSLDDGGKLQVWPPDVTTGMPHLANAPRTIRIRPGHSHSIVAGSQLWVAAGRDVCVYQPSADSSAGYHLLDRPITQLKHCGEITSGAIVNSMPDHVFFGHSDGKVSIYSTKSLTCIDVVSVSLYKINTMSGVGDYLWAGYQTGMMYVYDIKSRPWKVLKDWKAHERPVADVIADRTSIWKIDRLQVVSLSTDNYIRVWDGLMEVDWLEEEMQKRDVEFCSFRNIKAMVCSWNAGASKPQDLHNFRGDEKFLQNVLSSADLPDIMVFGFQELVDLENKKLTAKSIFKGKKSEKHLREGNQEHMSRQYRLWQEYLTTSIERFMPADQPYQLLSSANLVGLFTCVFVKSSERGKIRSLAACSVKTGLGGLHGNKGALLIRFLLDDTSLCFINCHLAAGQGGTRNRNKDIADILESNNLAMENDMSIKTNSYIGGGDGSMVLDHEVCILNGDLNYRIDHAHREGVIHSIRNHEIEKLLLRDQLLMERKRNPGFRLRSFNEEVITFPPTYKYDVGTDNYDSSEKKRMPSWCDRILYRGLGRIKQLNYQRYEVHASDHRPVSASFVIRLKTVSRRKREEILKQCERKYQEIKQSHVYEAKLDFLINVCQFPAAQAKVTLDREYQKQQ